MENEMKMSKEVLDEIKELEEQKASIDEEIARIKREAFDIKEGNVIVKYQGEFKDTLYKEDDRVHSGYRLYVNQFHNEGNEVMVSFHDKENAVAILGKMAEMVTSIAKVSEALFKRHKDFYPRMVKNPVIDMMKWYVEHHCSRRTE